MFHVALVMAGCNTAIVMPLLACVFLHANLEGTNLSMWMLYAHLLVG